MFAEAGIVEDRNGIAFRGEVAQVLGAPRTGGSIPLHGGEQLLQVLLAGSGHDGGGRIAALARMIGQQAGQVALEDGAACSAAEEPQVGREELPERRQRGLWGKTGLACQTCRSVS